jgi:hypothetical protein
MKKMILTVVIAAMSLCAFASEVEVTPKVLNAFNQEFVAARDVEWSLGTDYYKASFIYQDKYVFAYYSTDGLLMGVTRYLSPANLPLSLQKNLKENYNEYWISDLMEVSKEEGSSYFVTLENKDTKLVLKSTDINGWGFYKKVKKS